MQRHRLVYAALVEQLASALHALQIKAKTPAEIEVAEAETSHVVYLLSVHPSVHNHERKQLCLPFYNTRDDFLFYFQARHGPSLWSLAYSIPIAYSSTPQRPPPLIHGANPILIGGYYPLLNNPLPNASFHRPFSRRVEK